MSIVIDIQNNSFSKGTFALPDFNLLESWAYAVFEHESITDAELTLRLVEAEEMQALNQQYRQKDYPTNVLSFCAFVPPEVILDTPFLGDIILCVPVIEREAIEQHQLFLSHWAHMVVHGVLHLLGYDHEKDEDADVMEQKEVVILKKLGIANPYQDNEE